jgi:CHAD domain-containing protein
MDVPTLLEMNKVDLAHARHVADMSLGLFDAVAAAYALPRSSRRLIELGALLHNVGMTTQPAEHHLVGRDIVLRQMIDDLSRRERALLACVVVFHRKKVRAEQEPAYLYLGKKGRELALRLAAIVRAADGLDYSQSQTTQLLAVERDDQGLLLHLAGPYAQSDGDRTVAKADLWGRVFGDSLRVVVDATTETPAQVSAVPEPAEAPMLTPWYTRPDVALAELGRVLLRRHFRRMLAAEREVYADKDIEGVHQLRVSTRRLRAVLRLVEPVAPSDDLRTYVRGVQQVARVAGDVRDADVLIADLEPYIAALDPDAQTGANELLTVLRAERARAYRRLRERLDRDEYQRFKRDFAVFMSEAGGWDATVRVRDVAGSTIWYRYEQLRAFDRDGPPQVEEELHAMRIAGKRLRYTLELFTDVFGSRVEQVLDPLLAFQDHLGLLNDTAIARLRIAALELSDAGREAAECYLATRDAAAAQLADRTAARWEKIGSATYRRRLMELIVKL